MENNTILKKIADSLDELLSVEKQSRKLLEKMANREGALGGENESRIIEHLRKNKYMYKQQVCDLLDVSGTSALNIMKRLMNGTPNIRYIAGRGSRLSRIVYVEEGSVEDTALRLAGLMPYASMMSKKEIAERMGCDEDRAYKISTSLIRLSPKGEFFWQDGKFVHARS